MLARMNEPMGAFLYDVKEGMLDLNDYIPTGSGWELQIAYDINSSGQIVGSGRINGKVHAFLLTPVFEPAVPAAYGVTWSTKP